ncbi:hypothetical protein SADUNF_Sadunf13G0126300 [Salix dunnii]|uniref:Light-mediated development protein DET1 n=1 Tax=Salix dunnii TaxID=1413687 RepID=A0A835MLG9_9ROSI|nr:hypothetical protein SADUNF_Sadunf13G0126300 [Salix dunnii]
MIGRRRRKNHVSFTRLESRWSHYLASAGCALYLSVTLSLQIQYLYCGPIDSSAAATLLLLFFFTRRLCSRSLARCLSLSEQKQQKCADMLRNNNVVARIFQRQIQTPPPGTSVHCARRFYENLVPNFTIYDVECPDHSFRKFTDDGQYLISFSRNLLDLIVYRPTWLSYSYKEEDYHLPSRAKRFDSFFTQLYCVSLASSNEVICKDFFLYVNTNQFGLFATSTSQIHDAPAIGGAIQGVPSIERITFHLLRLEDGVILDEKVFYNDFINLAHNMGVFLYDDLLAVVSLRYQTIYILQIRESGNLVDVRAIGAFCREDDELFLNSNSQASAIYFQALCQKCMAVADKSKLHQSSGNHVDIAVHSNQLNSDNSFLSGIKQRLLSFIFQGIWSEETDKFQVQFLDRHHLLIKFGSVDGGVRLFMLSTTRIMSKV